jgi:predicted RNase H-like HicB family nuclease
MKPSDQYHQWVEWSDEDQAYLGKCPDLITGIHGDAPVAVYSELEQVVDEVLETLTKEECEAPPVRVRAMVEVD